jgi:hypothetical protein
MIEEEQAVVIARKCATEKGWAFSEPINIVVHRGWRGGIKCYELETNAGKTRRQSTFCYRC